MLFEPGFAAARSSLPSPLKSPIATDDTLAPATKLIAAWNVPSPFPSRTETLLEPLLATARSACRRR